MQYIIKWFQSIEFECDKTPKKMTYLKKVEKPVKKSTEFERQNQIYDSKFHMMRHNNMLLEKHRMET